MCPTPPHCPGCSGEHSDRAGRAWSTVSSRPSRTVRARRGRRARLCAEPDRHCSCKRRVSLRWRWSEPLARRASTRCGAPVQVSRGIRPGWFTTAWSWRGGHTLPRDRRGHWAPIEATSCQRRRRGRRQSLRISFHDGAGRQSHVECTDPATRRMAAAGAWTDRGHRTRPLLQSRELMSRRHDIYTIHQENAAA